MITIQQLTIKFNKPVVTPEGNGYMVGRDEKDPPHFLVAVLQKPCEKTKDTAGCSTCRHMWFDHDKVRDWSLEHDGKFK